MGLDVTMMSTFGFVALTGVVVNDSLVMVHFINRARKVHAYADVGRKVRQTGGQPRDRREFESTGLQLAIREAGSNRFRPILLTSLTTFFGLAPLMLARSLPAAFLVPMAVSLAFGVLFATFITLILVPTAYLILDDLQRTLRRIFGRGEPAYVLEAPPLTDDTVVARSAPAAADLLTTSSATSRLGRYPDATAPQVLRVEHRGAGGVRGGPAAGCRRRNCCPARTA